MTPTEAVAELARIRASASAVEAFILAGGLQVPAPAAPAAPAPPAPAPTGKGGLADPARFYVALRGSDVVFGGRLTPDQVAGIEADLKLGAGRLPLAWMAYCLATDYHETGHTMQPIPERGSGDGPDADAWDDYLERYDTGRLAEALGNTPAADGDGVLFAGKGKAQVTGARNYKFATKRLRELGVLTAAEDLSKTPDLMLRMDVATAALIFGMLEGWYTGKTLNHYLPGPAASLKQFENARRIINGTDRAELIASIAAAFQAALQAGGWS